MKLRLHQCHVAVARDPRPRLLTRAGLPQTLPPAQTLPPDACMPAAAPRPPKLRNVASWIMTRIGALTVHARAFATLMTERRSRDLEQWMSAATASGVSSSSESQ
jgi:hypothetical protein